MDAEKLQEKYSLLFPHLDEKSKRMVCAADARALGHGGVTKVEDASGLSRVTIKKGREELEGNEETSSYKSESKIRKEGGGRKKVTQNQPNISQALEALVSPNTRGDPESPLKWTTKSLRKLENELKAQSYTISYGKVKQLLSDLGYSLQAQAKVKEGKNHPDRDKQFNYINDQTKAFLSSGNPVISVDTKKKELVGDFKNEGHEYRPKGQPIETNAYDFPSLSSGKAIPYGVYDMGENNGWVSVGKDKDTAMFAANSIRSWWEKMGKPVYGEVKHLMITADNGGSNGSRNKLWKRCLQEFANDTGLTITMCHFPPGTSKWNKIEHRLFSFITMNWRGHQLISYESIVNLINSVKTKQGLTVNAELDEEEYEKGIKVTDQELDKLNLEKHEFLGGWNYTIKPQVL